MSISWENLYKVRINNPDDSFQKHEIIKLLILMKTLNRHKNERHYIHIYTEFLIQNQGKSKKTDLFYLNIRTKEAYSFEIQKSLSKLWMEKTKDFYKDWNYPMTKTSDLIIIPIKKLSNDIIKLNKELDEYVM